MVVNSFGKCDGGCELCDPEQGPHAWCEKEITRLEERVAYLERRLNDPAWLAAYQAVHKVSPAIAFTVADLVQEAYDKAIKEELK